MKKNVLLAGESWSTSAIHTKGFDQFNSTTFHLGAEPLVKALADSEFALRYMPSHEAQTQFPLTLEELQRYDAVILSDIGANTLLLHPDVWLSGKTVPNRLKLLREYVEMGGGLFMIGGYLSFQGINGAARYGRTAVEEVLPVTCLQVDDRVEIPEGFAPEIVEPNHPILAGLPSEWPVLLGINEVVVKSEPGVQLLARTPADQGSHPLLDIGPHWLPETFVQWEGYGQLWRQSLAWLTSKA
jgi:uncharacterized membrane protein